MSTPRLRLYLVRHGQVAGNREYRYTGDRDEGLTALGERQVADLARLFSEIEVRRVISSPSRRTVETAIPIAAAAAVEVERDRRLREQSYGSWEGLTRREVCALGEEHRDHLERFHQDPSVAPPGGEATNAVGERCLELVHDLVAGGERGPVALVSHVGPIKAILSAALELSIRHGRRLFLDPATVSVVDWGDPPLIRLFNAHSHLGWQNARWLGGAETQFPVVAPPAAEVRSG